MTEEEIRSSYELVPNYENIEEGSVYIKLLNKPFDGIIVQCLNFQIKETDSQDNTKVTAEYQYDVKFVPEHINEDVFTDKDKNTFEYLIGDIIIQMLKDYVDTLSKDSSN